MPLRSCLVLAFLYSVVVCIGVACCCYSLLAAGWHSVCHFWWHEGKQWRPPAASAPTCPGDLHSFFSKVLLRSVAVTGCCLVTTYRLSLHWSLFTVVQCCTFARRLTRGLSQPPFLGSGRGAICAHATSLTFGRARAVAAFPAEAASRAGLPHAFFTEGRLSTHRRHG